MSKNFVKYLSSVASVAKLSICNLAQTELENAVKKEKLDNYIVKFIKKTMSNYMPSGVVAKFCYKYVIKKFVIPNVAEFTQIVYDLLKSKIEKVTES
jgi:hypothetical protein